MPVVRSPSITSSHLNAVAPLVKVKRINSNRSEAETLYKVQAVTNSRVTSVVPPPKGQSSFPNSPFRGLKVFSDRKSSKENYSPPRTVHSVSPRRVSPPQVISEPIYAEPKKESSLARTAAVLTSSQQPKSKEERFEEQRQRREQRKRETQTTTPGIKVNRPSSVFDSLTKRR